MHPEAFEAEMHEMRQIVQARGGFLSEDQVRQHDVRFNKSRPTGTSTSENTNVEVRKYKRRSQPTELVQQQLFFRVRFRFLRVL